MITTKKGKVSTIKTKPAFSNIATRARRLARRPKPIAKRTSKRPRVKGDAPLLSESKVAAATAAMAQYYPVKYRNAVMPSADGIAMPINSITVTDKFQFTTISTTLGGFENLVTIKSTLLSQYIRGATYAGAVVATVNFSDNSALAALVANAETVRVVAMDVRIQPVQKSADITGEWGAYNFPFGGGPVGLSANNVDVYAGVARGILTDGEPSARFVWLPGDNSDSVFRVPNIAAGANNTAVWFSVRTPVATVFDCWVTTTINFKPNVSGMSIVPGRPVNVDAGAYARGMQVFNDFIQENSESLTNPVKADANHPGLLRRVARAIADTVKESEMLITALSGSSVLGRGISAVAGAIGGMLRVKHELSVIVSLAKLNVADRIRESDDTKIVHEDVLHALDVLARVEFTRSRGDIQFQYEPNVPNYRAPVIRKTG